ncbi:response regulator [bacterium]|nr:response regulator [bacterium]
MNDNKKRILIVDDEEDLTWSISKRIAKDRNILEVICANSGNRALKMLSEFKVDLIITDLRMPGIHGLQLLNEIKIRYPHIQIIVMTAHGSAEVREAIRRWGQTGYIEKPFEMNDLRELIYSFLDNGRQIVPI